MRLVPLSYPIRSIAVRWSSSFFSALGIGLTVAVLGGVLALREGFTTLLTESGSDSVGVYLRPGAQSEGESLIRYPKDSAILKLRPEIERDASGAPLAACETYLGIKLQKSDGTGTTIVPVRGIEAASIAIQGAGIQVVEGRVITFGTNEVMIGRPLSRRIRDCRRGDTLTFNLTPFQVVGIFEQNGAYSSEIWADVDRLNAATGQPFRKRVVARLRPDTDLARVRKELAADLQVPAEIQTERTYLKSQTTALGGNLQTLATILSGLMGIAAVLGAVNTMLAAVGARTREVGVLGALGYRGPAVFLSFLLESAAIGLVGGLIGCVLVLPLNGIETGTTNWNTFTEVAFAFRVTGALLLRAVIVAVVLGILGGALPAWRASRLSPIEALRRQ